MIYMKNERQINLFFIIILVIFNFWMIIYSKQPWIISSLNIFFHEAGHWIFGLFGQFIGVLGGTLGELLMPGIFVGYFWKQQNIPGQVFHYGGSVQPYIVSVSMSLMREHKN